MSAVETAEIGGRGAGLRRVAITELRRAIALTSRVF